MRRNGLSALLFILVLAVGGVVYTVAADNEPLLGLDLQGGVSVVLQPSGDADPDAITQAIAIIRQRVDGIGVAEPEIARQGDAIVVQLPGVKDRDRALELVGQTAELRFRPVLAAYPAELFADADSPDDESTGDESTGDESTDGAPGTTAVTDTTVAADPTATTVAGDTTATTVAGADGDGDTVDEGTVDDGTGDDEEFDPFAEFALTSPDDDVAEAPVILGEFDEDGNEVMRYQLGPTVATGDILSGASAELEGVGTWYVAVDVKGDQLPTLNRIATTCYSRDSSDPATACPTAQLAIVLDGVVQSAPAIQAPTFDSSGISITGSFSESEAKDLALVLKYGSLPVELTPQQTQSVSATLGRDALDAGVTAGLVGLALVAIYMLVYYRLLGLVAMASLAVSAALLWTIVAYLGESQGLALTLAGVTGIIVSIGVAVDSNVVFYEHLKEDVSRGRSLRTAIDGSFASAFSTIVKADVASLIGAIILYLLTVGPVRGFALYLALSTVLDLVASYFFMRPMALMLVRHPRLVDRPRWFGMPKTAEEVAS